MHGPIEPAKVAVLVLNRDGARFLDECFQSLLRNVNIPFDIYLIDNGSEDESVALTRARYPMVKVIEHGKNLGFAGAYDLVIRQVTHDYVILLNNDTSVGDNWLAPLVREADRDLRVAACGSKVLMIRDRNTIDHAGGMLTIIGSGLDRGKWRPDEGNYEKTEQVGFGCGCSLLIRRTAYLEVGGFDPEYVIYHEDVDLCWKMRLFGYSVLYVPQSVVYHHLGGGEIQSVEHPRKTYLCQKNRLANLIKNTTAQRLPLAVVVSSTYDVVRTARFVRLRRWDLVRALLQGYADILKNLPKLIKHRRFVQGSRRIPGREIRPFFSPLISGFLDYRRLLNPSFHTNAQSKQ